MIICDWLYFVTIWADGFIWIEFICISVIEFIGCEWRDLFDWVSVRVCVSCFTCMRGWLIFWVVSVRGRPYSRASSLCTCSILPVTISGGSYHSVTVGVSITIVVDK